MRLIRRKGATLARERHDDQILHDTANRIQPSTAATKFLAKANTRHVRYSKRTYTMFDSKVLASQAE